MGRQKLIGILTIAILALNLVLPIALAEEEHVEAAWDDPSGWYMSVEGVLATDKYTLYPFEEKSLNFGLSRFGELINSNTNMSLEYAGERDPFAAPAGPEVDTTKIPKKVWINGWFIDIHYHHEDWGLRHVWAGALFADKVDYGGGWIRVDDEYLGPGYNEDNEIFLLIGRLLDGFNVTGGLVSGGRKTNGTAFTDPLRVLYDGPRLFVAVSRTEIWDWYEGMDDIPGTADDDHLHLVDVVLTIIFNKVKKEVIVLKDVKILEQAKYVMSDLTIEVGTKTVSIPKGMLIQFSNREEWDLGAKGVSNTEDYSSYVHFYTKGTGKNDTIDEGKHTVYDDDWTMVRTLPNGTKYQGIQINSHGPEPSTNCATYDVAQIISNDKRYVGWHAFWPSLSDWSADAGRGPIKTWYRAMKFDDPHYIDSYAYLEPFLAPLIVGEWDFVLTWDKGQYDNIITDRQFRGVSVYGVTDRHDGEDKDMGSTYDNIIDSEVDYQLREVFKPWDLLKAVHKDTKRWVEWTTASSISLKYKPFKYVNDTDWDEYCAFSERVYDYTAGKLLKRGIDYNLNYNSTTGIATISGLTSGHTYKILYSTLPEIRECHNSSKTIGDIIQAYFNPDHGELLFNDTWTDKLGVDHDVELWLKDIMLEGTLEDGVYDIIVEIPEMYLEGESDFKVYMGETHRGWVISPPILLYKYDENLAQQTTPQFDVYGIFKFKKSISSSKDSSVTWPLSQETLHVHYLGHKILDGQIRLEINITNSEMLWNVTYSSITLNTCYCEELGGRYEWTVVGKDAATIDSAGAALVTAAFKNKQVEIGLAGEDMYDTVIANQMPWVMHKFGAGNTKEDYYYSATDKRTALRDDWSKAGTVSGDEWPIASSNMIGVGGPIANLLAYYGNDFMQALFGLGEFTPHTPWKNKIVPLTCWDMTKTKSYASSNTVGYAVISTYKDINGTVLFLIWGHWGRDTYYVTKWFHEEGIYQLQEAPKGLTGIIVKITYESTDEGYKPTGYSIVECLGTISETLWVHNIEYKGGIHDP